MIQILCLPREGTMLARHGGLTGGREVLNMGLLKRIGNGSSTTIWQDRWIPKHFQVKPLVLPDDVQISLVSEIITPSGVWNVDLIKQIFVDIDAHAILSTPIVGAGEDTWAWEPEVHGTYSVKSAHRLLYNEQWRNNGDEGLASTSGDTTRKSIWRLCVTPKVRVFLVVVNGYLPAKEILHKRHIKRVPNCDVCDADEESIEHVLLDCTAARCFWEQTRAY